MAQIDYYMITLSPFTYLAGLQLEAVAAKHNATINYKPFGLMKVFEEHGTPPVPQRHPSRVAYRLQELVRIGKMNNLPINVNPAHWPTNPVPSCTAIIAAQEAGGGDLGGLAHALCAACWADEKDVADEAVIGEIMEQHGFDPAIATSGMLSAVEIFERNTQDALSGNVFGAPTYVVGDQIFWGQDRLPYLDAYLAEIS